MRLLTLLAVAALAAGVYHYRGRRGLTRSRREAQARSDRLLEESVRQGIAGTASDEPLGDLGPMQSGIATGV
jgi:hypothetical protein